MTLAFMIIAGFFALLGLIPIALAVYSICTEERVMRATRAAWSRVNRGSGV